MTSSDGKDPPRTTRGERNPRLFSYLDSVESELTLIYTHEISFVLGSSPPTHHIALLTWPQGFLYGSRKRCTPPTCNIDGLHELKGKSKQHSEKNM